MSEIIPSTDLATDLAKRVRELETELASVRQELAEKEDELKRFVYVVSHDLRSPIVTIHGFTGMVQRDVDTDQLERVPRDLDRIRGAAQKMSDLLDVLLEISRIGRMIGEVRRGTVEQLVTEAHEVLGEEATASGLDVKLGDDLPELYGEWPRLERVFEALLSNAIKFAKPDTTPRVQISARPHGEATAIVVRDEGIGLDPAAGENVHEKVFELFQQLDNAFPGDGLGLAIAQRVVASHGGEMWIESEGPGTGCAVCFTVLHPPGAG